MHSLQETNKISGTMAVNFFREIRFQQTVLRLYGAIHAKNSATYGPALQTLTAFSPDRFMIETSEDNLLLSKFVWQSRENRDSFLTEECEHTESLAIAAGDAIGLSFSRIHSIDIDPWKVRMRLCKSALTHPFESLRLISRYHGRGLDVMSLEEVSSWRRDFLRTSPHAFEILFTDREKHMRNEILRLSQPGEKVAVIVGLSHVDALYELLIDS